MIDRPDVFLSYASADQGLAHDAADCLTRDGIHVWTDRQLSEGRSWVQEIDQAVRDSKMLVAIVSLQCVQSQHAMAERGFVMSEHRVSGKPLVPVQVGAETALISPEHFATLDARGLQPREIAERLRREVARPLGPRPAAAG